MFIGFNVLLAVLLVVLIEKRWKPWVVYLKRLLWGRDD
jgi:hypothetical protein